MCSSKISELFQWHEFAASPDIAEPWVFSRHASPRKAHSEQMKKLGLSDCIQSFVVQDMKQKQTGIFVAYRNQSAGHISDREVELMRAIGPHLCRVAALSNLLQLNTTMREILVSSLDVIDVGIVLVNADAKIVHANQAAKRMFEIGGPVRSFRGHLLATSQETTDELLNAIIRAQESSAMISSINSIVGIALQQDEGQPAMAHVLPLKCDIVHSRVNQQAAAVVFVTTAQKVSSLSIDALAVGYGLTAAETRVLERLLAGDAASKVAGTLGTSPATARTHIQRILSKTGMSRQMDLVALITRLTPPVSLLARHE